MENFSNSNEWRKLGSRVVWLLFHRIKNELTVVAWYSSLYMTITDLKNYNTKIVCSANYLRILINILQRWRVTGLYSPRPLFLDQGSLYNTNIAQAIKRYYKTLKVVVHTVWLIVEWSLSYLNTCSSRKQENRQKNLSSVTLFYAKHCQPEDKACNILSCIQINQPFMITLTKLWSDVIAQHCALRLGFLCQPQEAPAQNSLICINHFRIDHNAPCLPTQILRSHYLRFLFWRL